MATDFSRGSVETFVSHFLDFEFVSKLLDCSLNSCTLELFANGAFSMISIFFFLQHENLKSWLELSLSWKGQDQISMPNNNTCLMSCIFSSQYC